MDNKLIIVAAVGVGAFLLLRGRNAPRSGAQLAPTQSGKTDPENVGGTFNGLFSAGEDILKSLAGFIPGAAPSRDDAPSSGGGFSGDFGSTSSFQSLFGSVSGDDSGQLE